MKKCLCVLTVILLIFSVCPLAYANGGPGEGYDLLVGSNIKFVQTPDIVVSKENLTIKIQLRTSTVKAEYTLKNNGDERELTYIFPVTRYKYEYSESEPIQISFYDGGNKLNYKQIDEQTPAKEDSENADYYLQKIKDIDGIAINYSYIVNSYYETNLHFAKDETKVLTVEYELNNSFTSWGTSKSLLTRYTDVLFLYDMSPAAAWGNGKAGEFNLSVDYKAILEAKSIKSNFKSFKRESSGIYHYSAKDFDFAKEGQFSFSFEYPFEYEEMKILTKKNDVLSKVYASSTLAHKNDRYSVKNLFDGKLNTVWATDKGVGETIELAFEDYLYIGILNGHVQSKALYYDNARVKKLKIETYYFNSTKNTFEGSGSEEIMELPDIPYSKIDKSNPYKTISMCKDDCNFFRLTILEVYPGRKYKDVCISQIYPMMQWSGEDVKKGYDVVDSPILKVIADVTEESDIDSSESSSEPVSSDTDSHAPTDNKSIFSSPAPYIIMGLILLASGIVVLLVVRKKKRDVQS